MANIKLTDDELKVIAKEIYRLMRDEFGCEFKATEDLQRDPFMNMTQMDHSKSRKSSKGKERFSTAEIIDLLHLDNYVDYGDDAFIRWCDNIELVLSNNAISTQRYVQDMHVKIGIDEQEFESLNEQIHDRRNNVQSKERLYEIHNFIIDFIKAHHTTIAKSLYGEIFTVLYDMFADSDEKNYDLIKEIFTNTWTNIIEDPELMSTLKTRPILRLCVYRLIALKDINTMGWGLKQ